MVEQTQNDLKKVTHDLEAQEVIAPNGDRYEFHISTFQRECLLRGLDSIGWTLQHIDQIKKYEESIPNWRR